MKEQKATTPEDQEVQNVPEIKQPPPEGRLTSPAKLVPDLWRKNIMKDPLKYLRESINQEYVREVIRELIAENPHDPKFMDEAFDELREEAKQLAEELKLNKPTEEKEPF